jgi:hypothetical protein
MLRIVNCRHNWRGEEKYPEGSSSVNMDIDHHLPFVVRLSDLETVLLDGNKPISRMSMGL